MIWKHMVCIEVQQYVQNEAKKYQSVQFIRPHIKCTFRLTFITICYARLVEHKVSLSILNQRWMLNKSVRNFETQQTLDHVK